MVKRVILTLDELAQRCGYFSDEPFPANHGYNCSHPECGDGNEYEGKWYGACLRFSCPLAVSIEKDSYQGFDGDSRMKVHDEKMISILIR